MNAQYQTTITPAQAAEWGQSRETHPAVAMAIHAISDATRSPAAIWEAPTQAEWDHVVMAVENYVDSDVFDASEDGTYQWGNFTLDFNL